MKHPAYEKQHGGLALVPIASLLALATLGCSSDEEPEPQAVNATNAASNATNAASPTPNIAENKPLKEDNLANFVAPFSETRDPFAVPKLTEKVKKNLPEPVRLVRLIGLVNVDQPMAMLSIDGKKMQLLKVGDRFDGVKLLEINLESVFLESGADRWSTGLQLRAVGSGASTNRRVSKPTATSRPAEFRSKSVPPLPALPDLKGSGI